MFPHEEYLKFALQDCMITKLVQDLGGLYVSLVSQNQEATDADFATALQVNKILEEAATKIAALGPKPEIKR